MATPKGYSKSRKGFRASVRVGEHFRQKRFRRNDEAKIKAWRIETKAQLLKLVGKKAATGTLDAEITRYLAQVGSMPTFAQRKEHLHLWADELGGHLQRATIEPEDIRAVLQKWRTGGLAAATCNKRRTALMHLFTILDGKDARNPVRAVKKFRPADPLPRGRDPHVVDALLLKAPRCRTRACARVMMWTGMRPVELQRAEPDDVDYRARVVVVRTAKGGRARVVALTPQAVSAWKEFDAEDCWHRLPKEAPRNRLIKKWTKMPDLRIYDLRHTYGTALARRRTRLDVIGKAMGHSTLDLTRRYTLAAADEEALAATARLAKKLPGKVAHRKTKRKTRGKAA